MQAEIYITDDDGRFLTTMANALQAVSERVHLCKDGRELIDALGQSDKPAVIFLDIFMVGQDGISTIRMLKEIKRHFRLRFITGGGISIANMANLIAECNGIEIGETLYKPFSLGIFREAVADDISQLMKKDG